MIVIFQIQDSVINSLILFVFDPAYYYRQIRIKNKTCVVIRRSESEGIPLNLALLYHHRSLISKKQEIQSFGNILNI